MWAKETGVHARTHARRDARMHGRPFTHTPTHTHACTRTPYTHTDGHVVETSTNTGWPLSHCGVGHGLLLLDNNCRVAGVVSIPVTCWLLLNRVGILWHVCRLDLGGKNMFTCCGHVNTTDDDDDDDLFLAQNDGLLSKAGAIQSSFSWVENRLTGELKTAWFIRNTSDI